MVICHCYRVSDKKIREAVRGGACSRHQVERACDAGAGCGGCGPAIDEILETELQGAPAALTELALAAAR